jgi:tRNA pseudouridine32 synthase/23S rRNA pseudouridine746 synthase
VNVIDAVYIDQTLIVLNKPSNLLSVPGRGEDKQDCLSSRVQGDYPEALVVHRLDMATSGLVVMARTPDAQRSLNAAFAGRMVSKAYVAVVRGVLPVQSDWQTIDLPIAVDWPRRPLRVIDHQGGKPSITQWRCTAVDTALGTSRLNLQPVTGRSHQLRVHLQAVGHPILGDALYAPAEVLAMAPRLLLHAAFLAFSHPATGKPMEFTCPAPF